MSRDNKQHNGVRVKQSGKRAIVLGSTGSIGRAALDVLSRLENWSVAGLAAGSRWQDLATQALQSQASAVALSDSSAVGKLRDSLPRECEVFNGSRGMVDLIDAVDPCDCVIAAVVGIEGLPATIRAVELGRRVALANKESLVVAGSLIMSLARRSGATIIPVDSEHSAVFQAMQAGRRGEVRRVYLTASGGPFRTWSRQRIESATLEEALCHPTWNMGPKVTIDSATMMNKALEIVEARWLFDLDPDQIRVVVHPESIIHSLVEFADGSMMAQMGTPDMRTPIQYALTWPERSACPTADLDLFAAGSLHLFAPDEEKFPALQLGYEAARRGGAAGAVLNAANETAVDLFRSGRLRFPEIARVTKQVLDRHFHILDPDLPALLAADRWARAEVMQCVN